PDTVYRRYVHTPAPREHESLGRELQIVLRTQVPDYMVPAAIMVLDAWPLTRNGKLDRSALPLPGRAERADGEYVEPRSAIAKAIANIWSRVLDLDSVGENDSFFHLGGHSLMATQVMSRVRDLFGVNLTVRALFDAPNLGDLAR